MWTTDPEGQVVDDSPSWREFSGQSLQQWLGREWLEAVHPTTASTSATSGAKPRHKATRSSPQLRL
jgi:PAS domain-containing protein